MNKPSQFFVDYCKSAQISQDKIQKHWFSIWEKAIEEFLTWIVRDGNLTNDQLKKFTHLFNKIIKDKTIDRNIIDMVAPILGKKQKAKAINQFSELFLLSI